MKVKRERKRRKILDALADGLSGILDVDGMTSELRLRFLM
jgi:hypothetical protein